MENKHMAQIDGLRTFAVTFVLLTHWTHNIKAISTFTYLGAFSGVNLFFVLSGFLISFILIKAKNEVYSTSHILKQFYIRRFLRIFPLYYLVIIVGLIINIPNARADFLWLISYTANLKMAFNDGALGNYPHFWSLGVEEQYYIVFPMILLLTPKNKIKALSICLISVSVILRILPVVSHRLNFHSYWYTYSFTGCCLDSFGLGTLLAYYYYWERDKLYNLLDKYAYLLIACGIMGVAIVITQGQSSKLSLISFRLLSSMTFVWIIGTAAVGNFKGFLGRFLTNNIVAYLGKISYGIYVYHYFLLYAFERVEWVQSTEPIKVVFKLILFSIITIAVASISFYWFENPINKLKMYYEYNKNRLVKRTAIKPLELEQPAA